MDQSTRPWRSVLYIPASNTRALEKARDLPTDAIIFDLEDAVAPDAKADARSILADALAKGGYGARALLVRVNGLDTVWGADDLKTAAALATDGVLLPKVNDPEMLDQALTITGATTRLWAMMETPRGVMNAASIADHANLDGFVIGTNDLAKDIGCATGGDRVPMQTALQTCVLAARAAGIIVVDGVYNAFKDEDGLRSECDQGKAWGMDGKTLIHPAQLQIANAVFAPDQSAIDLAHRQISAYDAAIAEGQGVAVLDGKIIENLHVATARATLAKADAIAELEAAR